MSGPVSHSLPPYVAELGGLPVGADLASSLAPAASTPLDPFAFDDDLAMFTNTQFFDFDLGEMIDAAPVAPDRTKKENVVLRADVGAGLGFLTDEYQLADFAGYQTLLDGSTSTSTGAVGLIPAHTQSLVSVNTSTLSSPFGTRASSAAPTTILPLAHSSHTSSPAAAAAAARTGDKRKAGTADDSQLSFDDGTSSAAFSPDEATRLAAEEDKRRRNTAASARFRVKKKQREQTLERTAKEMTDKVSQLEARIGQLETENKWLKNLITEKNRNEGSGGGRASAGVGAGADGGVVGGVQMWKRVRPGPEGPALDAGPGRAKDSPTVAGTIAATVAATVALRKRPAAVRASLPTERSDGLGPPAVVTALARPEIS
ncbi:MAG: hypothetical protein M1826_000879 [Phylliscum demangeonii]|nr:MAG: hypothetical protein M1826_000879 [Phylliscum demangeonii]